MKEALIFLSIYALAFGVHHLHAFIAERRLRKAALIEARKPHLSATVVAAAAHPSTLDAIREYCVHLIVYSGYIIPGGH